MDQRTSNETWIEEYLTWTAAEDFTGPGWLSSECFGQGAASASEQFVAAYLDFMDGRKAVRDPQALWRARSPGITEDDIHMLEKFRQAILFSASRNESGCLYMIRRILDGDDKARLKVKLAFDSLDPVERPWRGYDAPAAR